MPEFTPEFIHANNRKIAYHYTSGTNPGVVFLGGFKSDMNGSKAVHLENWAKSQGRAFLRLDYSGHGQSSDEFTDGCIGDWAADAKAVINAVCKGAQVVVGSSMGGWIALLLAREMPQTFAGFVGIAAAPDFTEDSMWAGFSDLQKQQLEQAGQVVLPSDYDAPYIITDKLIKDGRNQLVFAADLSLPFAVRLLQGTDDTSVTRDVALRLLDHAKSADICLTFVKGASHSFSSSECLDLIEKTIAELLNKTG